MPDDTMDNFEDPNQGNRKFKFLEKDEIAKVKNNELQPSVSAMRIVLTMVVPFVAFIAFIGLLVAVILIRKKRAAAKKAALEKDKELAAAGMGENHGVKSATYQYKEEEEEGAYAADAVTDAVAYADAVADANAVADVDAVANADIDVEQEQNWVQDEHTQEQTQTLQGESAEGIPGVPSSILSHEEKNY